MVGVLSTCGIEKFACRSPNINSAPQLNCASATIRNTRVQPIEPNFKQVYQCARATLQGLKETNFALQILITPCVLMFASVHMLFCVI